MEDLLDEANTGRSVKPDRGYDSQANRDLLKGKGLRDDIARRTKPRQQARQRLDARNKTINRSRSRVEHVIAGLEQLGGKVMRALTLARNELAILLKYAAYNAKRLVWLASQEPLRGAR